MASARQPRGRWQQVLVEGLARRSGGSRWLDSLVQRDEVRSRIVVLMDHYGRRQTSSI
jgi:hypothetical protein